MCFFQVELVDDLGEESSSTLDSLDMDHLNCKTVHRLDMDNINQVATWTAQTYIISNDIKR